MSRIGAQSTGNNGPEGFRSVRSKEKDRARRRDFKKNPWSFEGRPQASLQKATGIENMMRYALLRKGINFIEQASIGPWCVDFYLPDYNTCLEADGEFWHGTVSAKMKDRRKDLWLKSRGYSVFHFDGWEIKQDSDFCVSRMMKSLEAQKSSNKHIIINNNNSEEEDEAELIEDHEQPAPATETENDTYYEQWINGIG